MPCTQVGVSRNPECLQGLTKIEERLVTVGLLIGWINWYLVKTNLYAIEI